MLDIVEENMTTEEIFYQKHLNRVSRSFAFCIARLKAPLRKQIGLSYLICRLLDTVEDSPWSSPRNQELAYLEFDRFMFEAPSLIEVQNWAELIPKTGNDGEEKLLAEADSIFSNFHSLPEVIRQVIRPAVLSMSAGMRYFSKQNSRRGSLRLRSVQKVNQYCFFVAGVVGEILTKLVSVQAADLGLRSSEMKRLSLEDGYHFGLFLQKVNLLKDQIVDEQEGRYLVPNRAHVLRSLKKDAHRALQYLLGIPSQLKEFKMFCAWSLFLGLASLPQIEKAYNENEDWQQVYKNLKIPREQAMELYSTLEESIENNSQVVETFNEMISEIWPPGKSALELKSTAESPEEDREQDIVASLYQGALSRSQLNNLMFTCEI